MTRLLIVDDDPAFCAALAESMGKRGHEIRIAHNVPQALQMAAQQPPAWALADLNMPGASGLALIPGLLALDARLRVVVLTGYASIATAVEAIKLGAVHYLTKPVSTDEIISAFHKQDGNPHLPVANDAQTLNAAERALILGTLERHRQNISASARELGLHRRTLQRKLDKLR